MAQEALALFSDPPGADTAGGPDAPAGPAGPGAGGHRPGADGVEGRMAAPARGVGGPRTCGRIQGDDPTVVAYFAAEAARRLDCEIRFICLMSAFDRRNHMTLVRKVRTREAYRELRALVVAQLRGERGNGGSGGSRG